MNTFFGRPKPDYFARCGKDVSPSECTILSKTELSDELKSFPSVYSATSVSSFLFLTLFMQKMIKRRPIYINCLCIVPLSLGILTGCLNIRQYKFHTDDVVGGFVIGSLCTLFIFKGSVKHIFPRIKEEKSDVM
ncbi:PAP2 superfamily protein [Histomonas meleagridis]|uniref:PAP2 superfamily protein n=1 Tax=Histomonas meleagridis TaxID=135588 RepID=UPI00355A497D|nr:PAP2 superfamily protein [Histomonas meleagridis]KAH0798335.1 PAP2 superfamily protein [Histomonas meleagridis]